MLPKFSKWIENSESSVSEPQHKKGEEVLTLNNVIEKRIKEMIDEFQSKGKAKPEEVLSSIAYFLEKNMPKQPEPQDNNQQADQQVDPAQSQNSPNLPQQN
jgi:hypothetical protein